MSNMPKYRPATRAVFSAIGFFTTWAVHSANAHAKGEAFSHAAKESSFASCAEFSVSLFSHWLFAAPHFGVIWLTALLVAPFAIGKAVRSVRATGHKDDSATGDALSQAS